MDNVGVMPPPDGVTPDFYSWTYLQRTVIIVYSVTFALATATLILRLYTGAVIVGRLGLDALFIVMAWAVSLAFFIAMVLSMPSGFGKHLWDVTPVQLQGYLNLLLVLALTYIWPPTLTKLAIVVLYWRINPARGFRMCLYLVAFGVVAYTGVFTGLFCGPCNPLTTGSGQCLNNIAVAQAVLNICTDGILIILPVPMIHQLNMPLKQKVVVAGILALGSGVILASCVRVAYVQAMQSNPDITWTQASAAVWSSVELNVGIVCNCLALLKPFVRRHLPWMASAVGGSSSDGADGRGHGASSGHAHGGGVSGKHGHGHGHGLGITGGSAVFRPWRGDDAKHSYQLHSVDKGGTDRGSSRSRGQSGGGGKGGGKGGAKVVVEEDDDDRKPLDRNKIIMRVDEYQVQYNTRSEVGDASSSENILAEEDDERGGRIV